MNNPSDAATLERAYSLVNEAMKTVALQMRRARSSEPEDQTFAFRWWADLQFLMVALRRLRRAAELAATIPTVTKEITDALQKFDKSLPSLRVLRNVGEHIDAYAVDNEKRHHKDVTRYQLQVGKWDGTTYEWLDNKLNVDQAHEAAFQLHQAVRNALKSYPNLRED